MRVGEMSRIECVEVIGWTEGTEGCGVVLDPTGSQKPRPSPSAGKAMWLCSGGLGAPRANRRGSWEHEVSSFLQKHDMDLSLIHI